MHTHEQQNKTLMFAGTILHNMFHGVVLFSAFSISIEFGIATTIAILLHSIPQNTANYIMNHNKELHVFLAASGGIL
jgi:zinc transporter ZupT